MLAGVTGEMVPSAPGRSSFFGSPLKISLGGGDGSAGGGVEKSRLDGPAPAKFEVMAIGVEVADLVARLRTTTEVVDDRRLDEGLFEESSSLGDALRLLETTGAGGCWV